MARSVPGHFLAGARELGAFGGARPAIALALSVLLHTAVLLNMRWDSGAFIPAAPTSFVEARIIPAQPVRGGEATPASTDRIVPAERTARAETPPPAAAPVLSSTRGNWSSAAAPVVAPPAPVLDVPAVAPVVQQAAAAPEQPMSDLPPAPSYHPSGKLSTPPRVLDAPEPVYPAAHREDEGLVVVRVLLNPLGVQDDVAVVRSMPQGVFDESALTVFRAAKFSPGYLAGVPVKSQIMLELKYTPLNRGAAVSGGRN